jgi:hypothetical protein
MGDILLGEPPTRRCHAVVKKSAEATIPIPAEEDSGEITRSLEAMNQRLTEILQPFVGEIQSFLDSLEGRSFGLTANEAITTAIQALLQRLGMRVRCPRCGSPAIPRCRPMPNTKAGSFQFEHYQRGRQTNHGGGTTFPAMKLVPAPPDRRRKRKKRK